MGREWRDAPGRPAAVPGIGRRVLLLMGVAVAAPCGLFAWAAASWLSETDGRLRTERLAQARLVADHADHVLRENFQLLAAIPVDGGAGADGERDDAVRQVLLRGRLFRGVAVLDGADRVVSEAGESASWNQAASGALAGARAERRPRVGEVRLTAAGRRLALVVPLKEAGARTPAVAVGLLAPGDAALAALLRPALSSSPLAAELADVSGWRLAFVSTEPRPYPTAAGVVPPREPAEAAALREGRAWVGVSRSGDGEELVAVAPLALAPWAVVLREDAREGLTPTRSLRRRLALTSAIVVVLALLFAHGAARSVIDPVRVLTRAAERVAAGEIDRPMPALPEDEVGRLGRALETMRAALQESLATARRANHDLERRVEERTREIEGLNRELRERDATRGRLLAKVIAVQEEERKRIARELHDETGQTLAALLLRLDAVISAEGATARADTVGSARALAARAVEGVHRLIFDLRPSILDDLGLVSAIGWYAERHLAPRGIAVRCELEPMEERRPADVETAVFRAVQESLGNVARHARAENVLIQVTNEEGALVVEIEDDGCGFDPAEVAQAAPSGRGLGLLGIRERLELVGGAALVESRPGGGTRVVLRVPAPVLGPAAVAHA